MRTKQSRRKPDALRPITRARPRAFTICVSLFFALLTVPLGADDLSEAERLELIKTAVDRAPTVSAALDVVRTHLDRLSGARRADALASAAELHALSGDLESAAEAYAEAADYAERGGSESAQATAARYQVEEAAIRLELGEVGSATRLAEGVVRAGRKPGIQRRAALLQARARSASGDAEDAFDLVRTLSEAEHAPTLQPATLLFLYRLSRRLERDAEAERARRLLTDLYPDSPEMMLVSGGAAVSELPRPSAFLGLDALTGRASADGPADAGAGAAGTNTGGDTDAEERGAEVAPRGVQVGSFKSVDNARDMRREIASAGFSAEIVDGPDGEFHRVIIDVPEGSDPQRLLIRLKEEGFEGFLVFGE
ncbi:MAG: hypothetical protein GVY23_08480 [Spirochaetes bacterium]|jgi:hypothetical protein|nr:hypothetical protein [Spirochaetota bacterium]